MDCIKVLYRRMSFRFCGIVSLLVMLNTCSSFGQMGKERVEVYALDDTMDEKWTIYLYDDEKFVEQTKDEVYQGDYFVWEYNGESYLLMETWEESDTSVQNRTFLFSKDFDTLYPSSTKVKKLIRKTFRISELRNANKGDNFLINMSKESIENAERYRNKLHRKEKRRRFLDGMFQRNK